MRLDIYRTIGIPRIVTQIRDLRRLMVNPRRLNFEYLGLYQEIPLFFLLPFARKPLSPGAFAPNRILIADATPLIGEFIASIPAISAYVRSRPNTPVDLLVAPVMVPLARKIRGIGKIFATEKPHPDRNVRTNSEDFPEYGLAVTLRMNRDSYRMLTNVRIGRIRTGAGHFIWYAAHLFASVCKRKTPVQWREMNFRMLDETPDDVPFETMFEFSESERNDVLKKPGMATDSKRIIVHTGTNWIMKQWENGKWIELLNRLHQKTGATFVFI